MIKCLLAGILLSASVGSAEASTPIKLELDLSELRLPEYTPCEVEGARYACYTNVQQAKLNQIEARANGWSQHLVALLVVQEAERLQLTLVNEQLRLANENDQQGRKFAEKLSTQLLDEIKKKNDWRAKAETPVVWPYIVGGSMLALGLGLGAGVFLAAGSN